MKKDLVVKQVAEVLENNGYSLVMIPNMHTCMDILAKKLDQKYIIKVVYNIDSASRAEAQALTKIASFMDAEPLIVGSVSKNAPLAKSISYSRFSVKCMSLGSLENIASDLPSLTASKSVGVKVMVDGERLKYLRKLSNMTRERLSRATGISTDTIYLHEKKGGYASIETVKRIEAALHGPVKGTPPQAEHHTTRVSSIRLANTGIKAARLHNAPFDMIAKSANYYEISGDANIRTMIKRAEVFKAIHESFGDNYPFFLSATKSGRMHGVPVLSRKQLKKIKSEHDLLEELTY